MKNLSSLSEKQLISRFVKLGRVNRSTLVALVLCLAEVHRRRIHLAAGPATLADYCRLVLKEDRRKAWRLGLAAEAVANFPLAGELLRSKKLSVSVLVALKKSLTEDNHVELLHAAIGLTEDEAEVLAARFNPVPRRTDSIRPVFSFEPARVPPDPVLAASAVAPSLATHGARELTPAVDPHAPVATAAGSSAPDVELVLTESYELRAMLTPKVRQQLEAVKAALSHKVPSGNLNDVLAECFRIALEVCERRKLGAPPRTPAPAEGTLASCCATGPETAARSSMNPPSPGRVALARQQVSVDESVPSGDASCPPKPSGKDAPSLGEERAEFVSFDADLDDRSRHIPMAVRRAVWKRDGGCCSFVGNGGHRCESRFQVQFDHWRAFSLGGDHTVGNVRLLCARHNRFEAERVLGFGLMRKYFDRAA